MRRNSWQRVTTCAASVAWLLAATAAPTAAQGQEPPPSQTATEARIQELIRLASQQIASGQAQTAAQTSQPTPPERTDTRATVRLTLDDAVKLGLERNLDIVVQRLNPATYDYSLASLEAVYKPAITSQLATQSTTTPSTSSISGGATAGAPVVTSLGTFNGGFTQNFRWGGGGAVVTLNNNKTTSTNATSLYNPVYNSNWSFQYTQPLLRGFATDSTRQQIVVTKLTQDISEIQLKSTITNTLSNVRNAYWDYVFATQTVDVARQSVQLADQLVKDNQTRVEVGTMAPIDVVQAQSQAAAARQTLVVAEASMRTTEIALKRLIVSGTQDPNWSARIDPIDRPEFAPQKIDVEAAVRNALAIRTDVAQAKKNVSANEETLRFLKNQTLPQADVVARYGYIGVGGTQLIKTGTGVGGGTTITGTVPGGYGDTLGSIFGANNPSWNVTLNFSYPLGQSTAEASVARARIQLNQVEAQLHQIELQVATEVTNAAVNVQSSIEAVQSAQAARELAQKQLDAENSKFEVGMSTNYLVVQSQRDLATAQNNELQAILAYRKSLVEMDRLQQTTLSNLNITVLSTGGLNTAAVGSGRPTVVAGGS